MNNQVSSLRWWQCLLPTAALFFLWPAAVNSFPFVFSDTSAYVRAVDAGVVHSTGLRTGWSNQDVLAIAQQHYDLQPSPKQNQAHSSTSTKPVLMGRSVFYGALLYVSYLAGSFWLVIALQALTAGTLVLGLIRHWINPADSRSFAALYIFSIIALCLSPLPFFVCFLMPDVFTGFAVLSSALLVVFWKRENRAWRRFYFTILAAAALFHSSHILIILAIGILGLVISFLTTRSSWIGSLVVMLAAITGVAGEQAFSHSVKVLTGTPPIRPPFLSARLIDDSPGHSYLITNCPTVALTLCDFVDRLPLHSDDFLWRSDNRGVFSATTASRQRALANEDKVFAMRVILSMPFEVFVSSIKSIGRQSTMLGLSEFNLHSYESRDIAARLPAELSIRFVGSRSYSGLMPVSLIVFFTFLWAMLAAFAFGFSLARSGNRTTTVFSVLLLCGWAINVIVCGALSTPHERYQARLAWLSTVLVVLFITKYVRYFARKDVGRGNSV